MKYVIAGNGIAGTTAALNIRKLDAASEIIIISEEAYPFYSRIRLINYLAGETDEKGLIIFKDEWYGKNRIALILNTKVISISPALKEVVLSDSRKIKYDRLLIATGGNSFVPPVGGSDKSGVFTLRNIADAQKIKEYAKDKDNVIILGGGVLGIEAGNALRKTGKAVSIVETGIPDIYAAGDIDAEGKLESIVSKDAEKGIYKKIVIKDNCVVGCILCGNMEGKKEILTAIKESLNISEMKNILDRLDLRPSDKQN